MKSIIRSQYQIGLETQEGLDFFFVSLIVRGGVSTREYLDGGSEMNRRLRAKRLYQRLRKKPLHRDMVNIFFADDAAKMGLVIFSINIDYFTYAMLDKILDDRAGAIAKRIGFRKKDYCATGGPR